MKKASIPVFTVKPYIIPAVISAIFILALLWQGAYFSVQYLFLLAIPFTVFALSKRSITITLNAILLTGLVFLMLLSLMLEAKEPQIGLREWLRYLLMPLYLLFFSVSKDKSGWWMKAFFAGIFGIAIFGLMAYTGAIEIPSGIIESSGRFQSTIQYANTTALLMLIGVLYSVHYFEVTKKWRYPIYAVGFVYCLYLTGSRTTFVLAFLVAVLFVLSKMKRRIQLISLVVLTVVAVGVLSIGGRIVRLSLTEPTLIERVITWQDGLTLTLQNPLFGLGIGNWQFEQFTYQSAPYGVRYIHNFYVQLLVDGGVLSALLFLTVIIITLWHGWKEKSIHFFVILAISLHIFMDFDMSFASIILILMFSVAQVPDKEILALSCSRAPPRFVALAPAILFLVFWITESNYISPDPLGKKFAKANQLASNGEYLLAIEQTEELLRQWRFNENYQVYYPKLLERAVVEGVLSDDERHNKVLFIEQKLKTVNPLYVKYINTNYESQSGNIVRKNAVRYETEDITYFSLSDPRWASELYTVSGEGDTSQTYLMSACVPTATAIIFSTLLKREILPTEIGQYSIDNGFRTENSGTAWDMLAACADEYGLRSRQTLDLSEIKEALKSGNLVLLIAHNSGKQLFTSGGHAIVLIGLEVDADGNERFIIRDPDFYDGKFTIAQNRKNNVTIEGDKLLVPAEAVEGEMSVAFILSK